MRRTLLSLLLVIPLLPRPAPVLALQVPGLFSSVSEAASSDVIFIGTVESVETGFLDRWHSARSSPDSRRSTRWRDCKTRLRRQSREAERNLPADVSRPARRGQSELQSADTHRELQSIFDAIVSRGKRTHFKVRALFKNSTDDNRDSKDAADKDADESKVESMDIWTDYGDCGIDFQKGETYLVYAARTRKRSGSAPAFATAQNG